MSIFTSPAIIQFIKYAIAGGVATAVHITVFHLICWRLFPALQEKDLAVRLLRLTPVAVDNRTRSKNSMYGNIIAFLLSNAVAYIINVLWVFQAGRHDIIIEILLFYTVSGIATGIGTAIMGILIRRYRLLTTWAFSANIFCAVMINYAIRKFFIFAG